MKTIIVVVELAILLAASACGDARGATPDAGATFAYSSRQQVKCNTVTMPNDPIVTDIQATCTNADDLPLAGSCSNPGPPLSSATLGANGPVAWEGAGAPAAWSCSWVSGGQAVHVANATATICCVVKSQ